MTPLRTMRSLIPIVTRPCARLFIFSFVTIALVGMIVCLSYVAGRSKRDSPPIDKQEIEQIRHLAISDPQQLADLMNLSVVEIPAGDFLMGSETGRDDERPQHVVYLDAFEIDRYEVTNIQYQDRKSVV